MKRLIKISCLLFIFMSALMLPSMKAMGSQQVYVIYFYSPTCSSCSKVSDEIKAIREKYKFVKVKSYNITDLSNKSLLNKYSNQYKVNEDKMGQVPVIFVKDKYLFGTVSIKSNLETIINDGSNIKTADIYDSGAADFSSETSAFGKFSLIKVFIAGLINGINPCSMSMLLFFITLIINEKSNVFKICLGFCAGKFTSFILLGTICFSLLKNISTLNIGKNINVIFIILLLCLAVLNIKDFFHVKNEEYGKVTMQLPKSLRRLNHNFMRSAVEKFKDYKALVLISFGIGLILALGEFLCTGQIYLSAIVTIIQKDSNFNFKALLYLVIYSTAYIIPLLILAAAVAEGKAVFDISERIRENLNIIKLINAVTFVIFAFILAANL